jgi:hypothetical protein
MAVAECSLAELIEDPLVHLVMKSDGVDRCELELLFERVGCARADWHGDAAALRVWPVAEPPQCSRC